MKIKLRAWDKINNEMVFPRPLTESFGMFTNADILNRFPEDYVMIWTGLTDADGSDIYEGDIFNDGVHVVFENGRFGTTYENNSQGVMSIDQKRASLKVVVDNIFESKIHQNQVK